MSQTPQEPNSDPQAVSLSRSFSRFGWMGFWLQLLLGAPPVFMLLYYFAFTGRAVIPRSFPFVEYLAAINLLTLLFTTLWSYRYTRLARRITDPQRCPTPAYLARSVWTGVIASAVGMFFSTLVILIESANLTFYFLKSPQAGVPVIQTSGNEAVRFVSSVDMISLVSLIFPLFAEQIVMMFNLRLLGRTTPRASEHHPSEEVGTPGAGGPSEAIASAPGPLAHSPTGITPGT